MGRQHQTATVQLDFLLPRQFNLTYLDGHQQPQRPVIIHRAICGSLERMLAILIEHTAGRWPFWLSPRQVECLEATDTTAVTQPYARAFPSHAPTGLLLGYACTRAQGHRHDEDAVGAARARRVGRHRCQRRKPVQVSWVGLATAIVRRRSMPDQLSPMFFIPTGGSATLSSACTISSLWSGIRSWSQAP